jgi:hypothetical protein
MEHRWGTRHPLETSVRLDARPHRLTPACLRNASSSGAYLETDAAPPLWTRICVELERGIFADDARRIDAFVIRRDERGIGIEWCEFGPPAILELIESVQVAAVLELGRHPAAGGARVRARSRTARERISSAAAN